MSGNKREDLKSSEGLEGSAEQTLQQIILLLKEAIAKGLKVKITLKEKNFFSSTEMFATVKGIEDNIFFNWENSDGESFSDSINIIEKIEVLNE